MMPPLTGVLLLTSLASAGADANADRALFGVHPLGRLSPVNTPPANATPYLSRINNNRNPHPLTPRRLLSIRGGGTAAGSRPSAALTFGQNLAGSVFSTFATIYGLACIAAPDQTARLFYNGYSGDNEVDDASVGRYLMRLMGSLACGIGLTSAFALGAEIKAGPGIIPSTETFDKSIGVGLVPRFILISLSLISSSIPKNLRICSKDAVVALVQTCLFLWSMFDPNEAGIRPDTIIFLEVAFHVMLGPLLFFKPSVLFEDSSASPSKHEKFMTRMLASYSVMGAVLVAALQHPAINALPAVGLAASVWVASLFHLTFVRKDVEECGTSTPVHVLMMVVGTLVAIGGLQQYIFFASK